MECGGSLSIDAQKVFLSSIGYFLFFFPLWSYLMGRKLICGPVRCNLIYNKCIKSVAGGMKVLSETYFLSLGWKTNGHLGYLYTLQSSS